MKYFRWALVAGAACGSGGSSDRAAADGPLFAVDGLTDDTIAVCITGNKEPIAESFVVRNVSSTQIQLNVSSGGTNVQAHFPKHTLDPGESETVTFTDPGSYFLHSDGSIDIEAARVLSPGTPPSDPTTPPMQTPAPPQPTQKLTVTVHPQVDDRAYTLTAVTNRVVGHQPGFVQWSTKKNLPLPVPRLAFDGPFEAPPRADGPTVDASISGQLTFRLAAGGDPGEEVSGAIRLASVRCSKKSLTESASVPVTARRADVATQVATGLTHSCALDAAGRVLCWGDNTSGQLGIAPGAIAGDTSAEPIFEAALGSGVTAIAAGRAHTCAVRAGEVLCWGDSTVGQCGPGTPSIVVEPSKVTLSMSATGVVARGDRSCAILADGGLACWGTDASGGTRMPPASLSIPLGATQFALGDAHQCMRTSAGSVWCSGTGGRIGNGTTMPSDTPVEVLTDATDIAAGATHTCAVTKVGALVCWGDVPYGSSGSIMKSTLSPAPFGIGAPPDLVLHASAAGRLTCAFGTKVRCTDYSEIAGSSFTMLDSGGSHVCAIFDGGRLACAGNNARKQLGLRTATSGMLGFDGP